MTVPATIALIAICCLAAFLMTVIWVLCWSDGDAIRADEVRLTLPLAEQRQNLTEPELVPDNVEAIHIGHATDAERAKAGDQILVERIARSMEPAGSPWRLPLEPGLSVAVRHDTPGWGPYRPRHRKDGDDTQEFKRIVGTEYGAEATEAIEVKAA